MSHAQHSVSLYLSLESELEIDASAALDALPQYSQDKYKRKSSEALKESTLKAHSLLDWALRRHFFRNDENYEIQECSQGKPLARGEGGIVTGFNLSHSYGHLAVACGPVNVSLGVDCEASARESYLGLTKRYFSEAERLGILDAEKSGFGKRAFFHTWTRKEAWVKMLGHGIQKPLDSFTVDINPEALPNDFWIMSDSDIEDLQQYATYSFRFPDGTPGAIACSTPHQHSQFEIFFVSCKHGKFRVDRRPVS